MKSNKTDALYERFNQTEDFKSYAQTLIKEAQNRQIPIDPDPNHVQHMVKNDLRDAIPARVFELMGRIVTAVEKASNEEDL